MKKIIFEGENGILNIMYGAKQYMDSLPSEWTEDQKLIHLANKDLPTGTHYEITDEDFSSDREFRNAWEFQAGNNVKISKDL